MNPLPPLNSPDVSTAAAASGALPSRIVIASRESRLAMWQAEHVRERLGSLYPATEFVILGMSTRGDQILDRPLSAIGGKGLFIKELEVAMQEGRADLAVHSMKDVPMEMPPGFTLGAIPARENPADAFVSSRYSSLDELPDGARVGTSSLRRAAQLRARYPRLEIHALRGNLDTRLRKLDEGQYEAIILAAAGLIRLGLSARIRALLPSQVSLPAPGQGALGIEIPENRPELAQMVAALDDPSTAHCVRAERAFSRALGGSCQVPLGAHANFDEEGRLLLRGFVASVDGSRCVEDELRALPEQDEILGRTLAQILRDRGAGKILEELIAAAPSDPPGD